eukprot:TRINITY_DN15021_c0_g1_i1.p1 TRINITY_DN15021_c0_g1~~TRINITY_DN15021_c0_g1_i1.p1  ORF type:complete len:122 (-),score=35.11 TRINITY_DN15021_c0_g1_i1:645-1010(-)
MAEISNEEFVETAVDYIYQTDLNDKDKRKLATIFSKKPTYAAEVIGSPEPLRKKLAHIYLEKEKQEQVASPSRKSATTTFSVMSEEEKNFKIDPEEKEQDVPSSSLVVRGLRQRRKSTQSE